MPTLTVLTPTCDRPVGIALLERWIARQTRRPDEWIVADGGRHPARLTAGQRHLHVPRARGAVNFAQNLLRGIQAARGDLIIVAEDDDWMASTHLERLCALLARPGTLAAGDDQQRYYNVTLRRWRVMQNKGASLCQTGFTQAATPIFLTAVRRCLVANSFGVDAAFWRRIPAGAGVLQPTRTVVGIKGLPGSLGLGVGHQARFMRQGTSDPDWRTLREWIGDDAAVYAGLMAGQAVA